jgi:hypothetical protein
MRHRCLVLGVLWVLAFGASAPSPASAKEVLVVERPPDPHGSPRPARGARHVPLRTSIYVELTLSADLTDDEVDPESVSVGLQPAGSEPIPLLRGSRQAAAGAGGWVRPMQDLQGNRAWAVYVEPGRMLRPETSYTVKVQARSRGGGILAEGRGSWSFTTEADAGVRELSLALNLAAEPVRWHGRFFSGICNVVFCTPSSSFGPTYDLMNEARKEHPRAWSYQRDFWMTGMEYRKPQPFLPQNLPNIVRERETRRIAAIEPRPEGMLLRVEDFFGHEQYGIPSGRRPSLDYHAGDDVLIADGVHDARVQVVSTDDSQGTVLVSAVPDPAGGWKIAPDGPLPKREDPDAPGLFAPGGCYLRKFRPVGTPCYYWGRLDKEWDSVVRMSGRRLVVNFADAPGDLSRDGRSWTTVKDYAEWHDVARAIAGHIIDRYGERALGFAWSIFNEPDLGPLFWRTDWDELQRFYDYATDAILRAFEDRGYDSDRVQIGGLELGGIFGIHLKLEEFLAHCSPRATAKGALPRNAAFADSRLDGKRSRHVESLCRDHQGKGSPCNFISIHSYNRSELFAAKLLRAKQIALEIDPDFYRELWVNSHESCPEWMPPPDTAAADSYLGNGYFSTWCADVVSRQLQQAARDPRYAFGETILTVWPPPANFTGINAVTRIVHYAPSAASAGGTLTIPAPIFHVLSLLSDLGDRYWVLPGQQLAGHTVGGFASRDERAVRFLLYAHHAQDTQSRSTAAFDIALDLDGLVWTGPIQVQEYRFDQDHNSYFRQARALRDAPPPGGEADAERLAAAIRALRSEKPEDQNQALAELGTLGASAMPALPEIMKLAGQTQNDAIRQAAQAAIARIAAVRAYSREELKEIRKQSELRPTGSAARRRDPDGRVRLRSRVQGNGVNFVVIRPDQRN